MSSPRVATCQFEPVIGDVDSNVDEIERLARALPRDVSFAVFPELCVTGYDLDRVRTLRTPVPGPITDRLSEIARDVGTALVVGLPEEAGDHTYNSLVLVSGDGVEATYRKRRPWGDEADRFADGTEPVTVDTDVGRVGFVLCYDLNFPELAVPYRDEGCDLLAVSAAWRRSFDRDWRLLCRARALDGTCYVVGSNHVGSQSGRVHAGGSLVVGPRGDVVTTVADGIGTAAATVDPEALAAARRKNPVREFGERT